MIEACALYFPTAKLPLETFFPHGRSDRTFFRAATWFEFEAREGRVRLNLRWKDLDQHLGGFRAYVARLPNDGASRAEAQRLISRSKLCVGVVLPRPVSPESDVFTSLVRLIEQYDGFMFVADSILLPGGTFLVGPMADSGDEPSEPPARPVAANEYRHEGNRDGVDPARLAAREEVYLTLATRGFRCSRWLPLYRSDDGNDALRPVDEIVGRLLALYALFLWVAAPEDVASAERMQAFVDRNDLREHLTSDELEILALPRAGAHEEHSDTIGWKLESMWALAWIVGFEPAPPFFQGQLSHDVRDRMLLDFLPSLDSPVSEFTNALVTRPSGEVGMQEDLYYCAHNAVRSAQLGEQTLPPEFHPVRDGGAIHERRHAFTWSLSPGTDWEDTDLST